MAQEVVTVKSDIEISREARLEPIVAIARRLGLSEQDLTLYGPYKAKIDWRVVDRWRDRPDGKLIVVSAMTPTPAGEGKTTVTVGLGQAFHRLGKRALISLREPSLGPCFGIKGGATGGGYSQVVPMEDINLHFTGDFHAVTSAHNLLAAMVDNHLQQGNPLGLDPRQITWRRAMDMNERALRTIIVGLGGRPHGVPREAGFDITAASEIMACLCLANSLEDLKARFRRIVVGYTYAGKAVTAGELGAAGAMAALMKEAINPNLVQTLENTPAFVHGGPFGNVAHGTNSILATRLGMKLAEYMVTETGFGFDLSGEKFLNIVSRYGGFQPAAVIVVASIRGLKYHGGVELKALAEAKEDVGAVERGLENLDKQVENVRRFGLTPIVALNRFLRDTDKEIAAVEERCRQLGAPYALAEVWAKGGAGGIALAEKVMEVVDNFKGQYQPLYDWSLPIKQKIEIIAREIYGADGVSYTAQALTALKRIEASGGAGLPICMAKTQGSLSDDPKLLGRPRGFTVTVRDMWLSAGAGFVVAIAGEIMTMPGLPREPAALKIDVDAEGNITGLF